MAHLPEGWESDYDGSRWFYRYKTTGLTQYHFPRPGDEFPELVGVGFGPLELGPESKLVNEYGVARKGVPNGTSNNGVTTPTDRNDDMSATGYFDPDNFMYFGLNDASPVGNEGSTTTCTTAASTSPADKSKPVLAELESAQRWSPVGFVSELATGDTEKCAEELAPIELDATQIAHAPLKSSLHQNGVAELSTERIRVEEKAQVQRPVRETMEPVEEYPLVSASFAYPPLKTTTKPANGIQAGPPQEEQNAIASQRPPTAKIGQTGYETWKPTNGTIHEGPNKPNRNSMTLSGISVLQSQNTELGPINQKRHSLSGPVESSGETPSLPSVLRKPSDPKASAIVSTPPSEVQSSPIPAVLRIAASPTKVKQDNSQAQSTQNGLPPFPGSGARHESISYGSGVSGPVRMPSMLRPANVSNSSSVDQRPQQTQAGITRPGAHRVNTLPNQLSSHTQSPPKLSGPGIYVFQEIPSVTGSTAEQNKPHSPATAIPSPSGQGISSQEPHQSTEQFHPIVNEPLPVAAPLSLSRPQEPASPDGTPNASIQGSKPSSPILQHKPQRKPLASQGTENANPAPGMPMIGSTTIQIRPHPASQQGSPSPTGPPRPSSVLQERPHSVTPQVSPGRPFGRPTQANNYQKPSMSSSPQHSPQASQSSPTAHAPLNSTDSQGQTIINNTFSTQASVQMLNNGISATAQAPSNFSASFSSQPVTAQAIVSNQQRPSLNSSPSPRPQSYQPASVPHTVNQRPDQNTPAGMIIGQYKPQSPSPITHPVSPLQSQVSSPTPSITSLHRPPSSASSHTYSTAQSVVAQNRPPNMTAHQNSHVIRPPVAQTPQVQANQQINQSSIFPITSASKPFPMLPGQVKPLPSQVGSPPVLIPNHVVPSTPVQTQSMQGHMTPMNPTQQQYGSQQVAQAAAQRPPQQQHTDVNHVQLSGSSIPGQPAPATIQHGQPRPTIQGAQGQQQTPIQSPTNGQNPLSYLQQSIGNASQSLSGQNGQTAISTTNGTTTQLQVSHGVQSPATQQFSGPPTIQGQQQANQSPGFNSTFPQVYGQSRPFTSAQAAAALSDAGKKMKKWAKKTWQNPAMKQSSAAIGGAIIAESLGMNGTTGASLGNAIYNNTQGQPQNQPQGQNQGQHQGQLQGGQVQNQQQQRPPGLQHAYTAPPQTQTVQGGVTSPQMQAIPRPQLQQGLQHAGIQTPGRPPILQNQGITGAPMNYSSIQPNMMNQQTPYQVSRPPVGRPTQPQIQPQQGQQLQQQQHMQQQVQQPTAFSQPVYQASPGQSVFQGPPGQPPYQVRPNPVAYQMPPTQPAYQAPGTVDSYVAIGATIGGVLTAFTGNKPDAPARQHPAANPEQHHTQNSEPQHETYSEQHGEQSEQQSGQHHTEQSEQYHESYSGQYQETHAEAHQQTHTEQNYANNNEQQNTGHSNEDRQTYSGPAPAESYSNSESYFAPQPETTIINNTIINNIENTAMAESTQMNANYTDDTQVVNMNQMNMNYVDNSQVENTNQMNMMNADMNAYTDTTYIDATNNMNATGPTEITAFAEATYIDSNTNTNMNMNGDTTIFADTTAYADASYTDASYMDQNATYIDATAVVDINVDMSLDMSQAAYFGDETTMMAMEGNLNANVGVDASASFMETSTVDYSGGDWGGGEW
ncbi:hypothetical protein F5Y11DRAFT_330912 [Daldinia sp. FL1419]|nr:hypothetical protein F5Y11DRAFT_330912 [Daldinia sp. FL1419]